MSGKTSETRCKHCQQEIKFVNGLWYSSARLKEAIDTAGVILAGICSSNSQFSHVPTPPEGEAVPEQVMCNWRQDGNPPFNCKLPANHYGDHSPVSSPIPAPVVNTAAPEPPDEICPNCQGVHAPKIVMSFVKPVAPESYKPAEGPESLSYEQEIHSLLCAAASNTENLLEYFQIQAANEKGEAKKLTHKCIAWKREQLHRIREIIPKALAAKNKPAATPVTVEAPKGEKWVEVPESEMQKARKHISALLVGIWPEDGFDTVEDVQAELNRLRATPKPIGDVEAVNEAIKDAIEELFRHICVRMPKNSVLPIKFSEAETIMRSHLSPFFAPAPPCSECATLPAKWNEDSSLETWFPLTAEELKRTKLECATLRKERDEAKTANYRAFVAGAKWWEFTAHGGTMWGSDQTKVEKEAESRWPYVESMKVRLAEFRAEAAEAQLSTLRDALEKGEVAVLCECATGNAGCQKCMGAGLRRSKGKHDLRRRIRFLQQRIEILEAELIVARAPEHLRTPALAPTPEVAPKE